MVRSLKSAITDEYYFTVRDVAKAFSPIVGEREATDLAATWSELYAGCIVNDRVVALPPTFEFPRLGGSEGGCAPLPVLSHPEHLERLPGRRLLSFSPGTITFVAAASPEARARFDRIGLEYGFRTIDDPIKWQRLVDFLKNP